MSDDNPDIQQKLQLLRQQYAQKLPARIIALEQQWLGLNLDDLQSTQYESLIREFHSLAGSGTSFGFPRITTLSREVENILLQAKTSNNQSLEQIRNEVHAKLASLKQAATADQD